MNSHDNRPFVATSSPAHLPSQPIRLSPHTRSAHITYMPNGKEWFRSSILKARPGDDFYQLLKLLSRMGAGALCVPIEEKTQIPPEIFAEAERRGHHICLEVDLANPALLPHIQDGLDKGARALLISSHSCAFDASLSSELIDFYRELYTLATLSEAAILTDFPSQSSHMVIELLAELRPDVFMVHSSILDWDEQFLAHTLPQIFHDAARFSSLTGFFIGSRHHGGHINGRTLHPQARMLMRASLPGILIIESDVDFTPVLRSALRIRGEYQLSRRPFARMDLQHHAMLEGLFSPSLSSPSHEHAQSHLPEGILSWNVGAMTVMGNFSEKSITLPANVPVLLASHLQERELLPGNVAWLALGSPLVHA